MSFDVNTSAVDVWTFTHTVTGVAMGAIGLPWWLVIPGVVVFEAIEYPAIIRKPQAESEANVAIDILSTLAGWVAGRILADRDLA